MDTSTHIAMGFGLAGLASLDPAVAADPALAQAVLAGTLLGSNAPDFDYAVKLAKGQGMYLRHHRAASHSVPALFLWGILLTACIWPFFAGISAAHLFGWTLAAVLIHVFVDLFNSYGTQAGRPFLRKWITFDAIYIFDPFIMALHVIGFVLWGSGFPAGTVFAIIYFIMIGYMVQRAFASKSVKEKAASGIAPEYTKVKAIPTISWGIWNVCAESESSFITGEYRNGKIEWIHHFEKDDLSSPVIQASIQDQNVQHFLVNAEMAHPLFWRRSDGYEVRWFDVRYRTKNHYPFMAIVKLDHEGNISESAAGWLHHVQTLEKPGSLNESVSH
ncbi:metal-dependent hydrolase [Metabacillus sp. KIGAM252]|uniref:Metal-dependent hydrolase n=1 Tax=Metabacillus flavus TaxID=2823519 RepID=A0ABS5LF14_9BACI|nr:metal-dependent hydrolase [Metabacillus flavus]MBS2969330.1 metal-dependent hydrolase [Metabacillus flavus]